MKKITAIIVAVLFIATSFNVMALDAAPDPAKFDIPKAPDGFTIGDISDEAKWTGALLRHMTPANSWAPMDAGTALADFEDAKFWFLWSDAGIYFRADIKNKYNPSVSAPEFGVAYNRGNSLQFFPALEATNDLPGWTFHPYTLPDGIADVWRHWPAEDRDTDAKIFVKITGNAYIMEGLMPASSFANPENTSGGLKIAAGASFLMPIVVLQAPEEGVHDGISESAWFDTSGYQTYTLSATQSPGAPPPPEPEPEPVDDTASGGGSDAPEQPVVVAPSAPKTGDASMILVMLTFAALGAAAVFTKKAKSKT